MRRTRADATRHAAHVEAHLRGLHARGADAGAHGADGSLRRYAASQSMTQLQEISFNPLMTLSRMLGHRSVETTSVYLTYVVHRQDEVDAQSRIWFPDADEVGHVRRRVGRPREASRDRRRPQALLPAAPGGAGPTRQAHGRGHALDARLAGTDLPQRHRRIRPPGTSTPYLCRSGGQDRLGSAPRRSPLRLGEE